MIEQLPTSRPDRLEFRVSGAVTAEDYQNTLIPALDDAIAVTDRIRALIVMESGVSDFTLGAMMDDARMGLKHWRGFDRIAVVTGSTGMRRMVRAFSVFMPCPVHVFPLDEADDARRWLSESLGSIHQTDLGGGVLHVQLLGQLDTAAYDDEAADMDAFIRRNDRFRLLLDIRDFDGWQGLGGLGEHFRLVRDHAGQIDRVAIVGDGGWKKMAAELGRRVIGKEEARYFDADAFDAARDWLTGA